MTKLPLILLAIAFLWASVTIAVRRRDDTPPGVTVIRIGHFQLESGVRDAFEKLGQEFADRPDIQKSFGRIKIVQEAIPEDLYGQWMTSQMMAGAAPDLVEIGNLPDPILIAYQSRYFQPLTHLATSPNPFNKGTPLENVPLKETMTDGMRSGYTEELQAYTRVPLARFTQRLFYNRSLLQKLTGLSEPPADFREFLDVCRKIAAQKSPDGRAYIPVISSRYHSPKWYAAMSEPLSFANLFTADFNRDGVVPPDETYAAFATGRMSLRDPPWVARFASTRSLIGQFQRGFVGLGRDEAVFLFAQQKGVFFLTGTWDIHSLVEQASGAFDVAICDFPRPSPADKELGNAVFGPVFDPPGSGFPFG